jgi:hypothetical protein
MGSISYDGDNNESVDVSVVADDKEGAVRVLAGVTAAEREGEAIVPPTTKDDTGSKSKNSANRTRPTHDTRWRRDADDSEIFGLVNIIKV